MSSFYSLLKKFGWHFNNYTASHRWLSINEWLSLIIYWLYISIELIFKNIAFSLYFIIIHVTILVFSQRKLKKRKLNLSNIIYILYFYWQDGDATEIDLSHFTCVSLRKLEIVYNLIWIFVHIYIYIYTRILIIILTKRCYRGGL